MSFAQRKHLILTSWVAVVAVVGVIVAIDRPAWWILIASVALVPAAIANWFWNAPEPTLSELIAVARSRT